MSKINILFVNCGRRVELIQEFRKAYKELKLGGRIITCDIIDTAPAAYFGDRHYLVSKTTNEVFVDGIIEICKKESINLVIPLIDPDLIILSKNKKHIEEETGSFVMVSNEEVIQTCRNKYNLHSFATANGFDVPKIVDSNGDVEFPVFIKPLDGSGSINTFKVENYEELHFFKTYVRNPIVQEYIDGKEYTVDAFLDFEGKIISIVPRLRIKVRAGEVVVSKTVQERSIIETSKNILEQLKPRGPVTLQFIKKENKNYLIEINPRFGGGCPLSINAGAVSPQWILKILMNIGFTHCLDDFEENLVMMRYDQSIFKKEDLL